MNLKNLIVKGALITSLLSSPLYSGCIRPYDTEVQEGETTGETVDETTDGTRDETTGQEQQDLEKILAGDWISNSGVVFHFDQEGILDYFGKEQFGNLAYDHEHSRKFNSPQYGEGTLSDYTQMRFNNNEFSAILSRDLLISDFIIAKYTFAEGKLLDKKTLELKLDFPEDDFYGANLEDGTYRLRKK